MPRIASLHSRPSTHDLDKDLLQFPLFFFFLTLTAASARERSSPVRSVPTATERQARTRVEKGEGGVGGSADEFTASVTRTTWDIALSRKKRNAVKEKSKRYVREWMAKEGECIIRWGLLETLAL